MKRDLELWRAILLKVEKLPVGQALSSPLEIRDYEEKEIAEHVRLLQEKHYIEAKINMELLTHDTVGAPQIEGYEIYRLFNDGHDFIVNAKNPKIWQSTVDFIRERGGDVSLAVTKAVMAKEALQLFGLS